MQAPEDFPGWVVTLDSGGNVKLWALPEMVFEEIEKEIPECRLS
jgi:hypothetical protein